MMIGLNERAAALKALCLSLAILFISGCVTTEAENRMQYQINSLGTELNNIKQKSQSIETQFPGQQKQNRELEEAQQTTAKTVSDLLVRIQYLTTEVQMLTGRFEEARYDSEKNSSELKESKEMLFAKIEQLEIMVEDLKKRHAGTTPVATSKEEPRKTEKAVKDDEVEEVKPEQEKKPDVKDAYMAAYDSYSEERTVEAREKFKALLTDYSENEYSDNARFWIAESYYKDGNYEDAILAYEDLFKKNPDSDKIPGAMLKQGMAFYALQDEKTGKIILEKLVDKFPESDQAMLAIKKMNKAAVPPKNN